jgi:hypothetical protein
MAWASMISRATIPATGSAPDEALVVLSPQRIN